jgi:hypothetical protein
MSRACDLGPGDVWALPIESVRHCNSCGVDDETADLCSHGACPECRDCCGPCVTCHEVRETDDLCWCVEPRCLDCGCRECAGAGREFTAPCAKCGEVLAPEDLDEWICADCDPGRCRGCHRRARIVVWHGRTTERCRECYDAGLEDHYERTA